MNPRIVSTTLATALGLTLGFSSVPGQEIRDLKYGAVLFDFYQQKYFDTLVEFEYAAARGGILEHGNYPELLKGGVSLSYGLDRQARNIFSRLIAGNTDEEVQNRAWYYLAKMLYLRGDIERAAAGLGNIRGSMPTDIDQEYRYLAALVNIKLGYFDEAEAISSQFRKNSPYTPYLYFNLGVAAGRQNDQSRAVASLNKSAAFADGSAELERVADRSHLAMAYLASLAENQTAAHEHIRHVSLTGVYSNRALLGSGWASVNQGSYRDALTPLSVLEQRSIAIPEVQEAVLLVPHVYEKLGLTGRAADGFIRAYALYGDALEQLALARESLEDADVLELFVSNMDDMLAESDWFGTAPSVSLNALSPFLLDLMSDHGFQSVLKDLRDLYAIRNNLDAWKRKQDDFDVIIHSRLASVAADGGIHGDDTHAMRLHDLGETHTALARRAATLEPDEQQQVQWLLADVREAIETGNTLAGHLRGASGVFSDTGIYAGLVVTYMEALDHELEKTAELIEKVENVVHELVNAELQVHEERLKYYRIQSHLAKVRILDQSLTELDGGAAEERDGGPMQPDQADPAGQSRDDHRGDDHAA
jgi:tetratricopeptide (TPR) repeat protein